jgi:pimeloyl-ACP methyl ester carboxylesterase
MHLRRAFLFLIPILFSSCLRGYINTEREIKKHFKTLSFKPTYKVIKEPKSQLFVATFGADTLQPIIFIHGAPGRWDGWFKQVDDTSLHTKFQLLVPDRPGYGKSFVKKKYKIVDLEKQVALLEKALELNKSGKKAILVGRSYGAPIGAYMAYKNPEKYQSLIMVAPAMNPNAEKFFKFSKYGKWPLVRVLLPKRLNTATDEKYAHIDDLKSMEHIWENLKLPVTTFYGGKDWVVSPENFEYAKAKMGTDSSKKYVFIPEAGHRISMSHPELIKAEIIRQTH